MASKKYEVLSPLTLSNDKPTTPVGEIVDLDDELAAPLMEAGAIRQAPQSSTKKSTKE